MQLVALAPVAFFFYLLSVALRSRYEMSLSTVPCVCATVYSSIRIGMIVSTYSRSLLYIRHSVDCVLRIHPSARRRISLFIIQQLVVIFHTDSVHLCISAYNWFSVVGSLLLTIFNIIVFFSLSLEFL